MIAIDYIVLGNKESKNVLVFLHGWGGDEKSLFAVYSKFLDKYCVISFSLHSIEKNISKAICIDDYANEVLKSLEFLKIKKAIFVCHSFGARVLIKLNLINSQIIEKIIFLNPAGIKPKFSLKKWLKIKHYKLCKKMKIKTKNAGSEDYKVLSPIMQKTFINIINEHLEQHIAHIVAPTLLIGGDNDLSTPPYMLKKMQKLIENSQLKILKNCSHYSFLDCTNNVVLLAQFFINS